MKWKKLPELRAFATRERDKHVSGILKKNNKMETVRMLRWNSGAFIANKLLIFKTKNSEAFQYVSLISVEKQP